MKKNPPLLELHNTAHEMCTVISVIKCCCFLCLLQYLLGRLSSPKGDRSPPPPLDLPLYSPSSDSLCQTSQLLAWGSEVNLSEKNGVNLVKVRWH